MFKSVKFHNFKALRDTSLPLGPFTLLVGPNGSGKSTALEALRCAATRSRVNPHSVRSIGADIAPTAVAIEWADGGTSEFTWQPSGKPVTRINEFQSAELQKIRFYSFDGPSAARAVPLQPSIELAATGANLAGVLDRLRDEAPERFRMVNEELSRWLPEFDQILFETPDTGLRQILLRARKSKRGIRANDLSDGTLFALVILTIAYSPNPPPFVAIEEPERGIHPRLLRRIQDALYKLAYPKSHAESREPVQVMATTHSPLFLDLFRDHPEEIVVAEKLDDEARFVPLIAKDNLKELLGDAPLGDLWYSGILGGVPAES